MTASVLKQDPSTKRFKRTLIYFDTDTQYSKFKRAQLQTGNSDIINIRPNNIAYRNAL